MSKNFSFTRFLRQPYPFYYEGRTYFYILGILFLMGLGFNYFFRPFDINTAEHKMSYFLISFIHTLTAIAVFLLLFIFLKWSPNITKSWNVKKEIITLTVFLFVTGIGQFLIRDIIYDNPNNWSFRYLFEEVRNTFLVGILFIAILVPANFNWLYHRNSLRANTLKPKNTDAENNRKIFVKTHLKGDDFYLESHEFIFARSEGNYVEIALLKEGKAQKLLKRISIKDLENQLAALHYILRTHRSYLVNLNFVSNVTGNAQGYRLGLNGSDEIVAVSRKMIPLFEDRYLSA